MARKQRGVSTGRWVPTAIRRELWAMPCVVCGDSGDIECDHIIPFSRGGKSTRENLQPLCRVCNAMKRDGKSNEELKAWIAAHSDEFKQKKVNRAYRVLRKVAGSF